MSGVEGLVSLGVLGAFVPRDVVDEAVLEHGRAAKRSDGKLPPWAVVYLTMLMALYPDDDYEELAVRVAPLVAWGREELDLPASSGAVTQARQRLGHEVLAEVFSQVAAPVASMASADAFLGPWRLCAIDGFEVDVPDTAANVEAFGYSGTGPNQSAYPKARVVAVTECASRAVLSAAIGAIRGKGSGERSLAGDLWAGLTPDELCLADAGFYSWTAWEAAAATGAELLWRISESLHLPVIDRLPDGSYLALICAPGLRKTRREQLLKHARDGGIVGSAEARIVRVIEYDVPDRQAGNSGGTELITLITTITDPQQVPATELAEAYHRRWDVEGSIKQVKNHLRPSGKVLRSKSPDLVKAEIYGMLLTQWALARLICEAVTETDTTPERAKFARAIRIVRRHATRQADFSP